MLVIGDIKVTGVLLYRGVAQLGLRDPELVVTELGMHNHFICGSPITYRFKQEGIRTYKSSHVD